MPRILIIAASLGLTLILGILFLWPQYQNLQNIQLKLENKETELINRDKYYQNLFSLSEKLREFETELSMIDSALPSEIFLPSLYHFFRETSSENGLILTNITTTSSPSLPGRENIQVISISIEVSGSYSSLRNFLKALEKSARIIEVNNVSFNSPGEEELFNFQLKLQTYSY